MQKQLTRERVQRAINEGFKDGCAECGSREVRVRTDEPHYEGVPFDVACQTCGYKQEMTIMPPRKR